MLPLRHFLRQLHHQLHQLHWVLLCWLIHQVLAAKCMCWDLSRRVCQQQHHKNLRTLHTIYIQLWGSLYQVVPTVISLWLLQSILSATVQYRLQTIVKYRWTVCDSWWQAAPVHPESQWWSQCNSDEQPLQFRLLWYCDTNARKQY